MKKTHAITAATIALTAFMGVAQAAKEPGFEIGLFTGIHFFSHLNELGRPDTPLAVDGTTPSNFLMVGPRLGWALNRYFTIEAEAALIPTKTHDERTKVYILTYRGHLLAHLTDGAFRPFILAGGGGMTSFSRDTTVIGDDTDGMFYGGGGFKLELSDTWAIRLDGRVLFPPSTKPSTKVTTDFEGLLGISARFGGEAPPPPAPVVEATPVDTDGDGIPNDKDACINEPEDMDGFEDTDGCPETDNDKDEVADLLDKCPNEAGSKDNFGCPDKDEDGDSIVDRLDKCPKEAETKNGFEDEDGCPDEIPQAIKQYTGTIEGIKFKTGSSDVATSSYPLLDKAAVVLKEYPSIKMEISGHTDNKGNHDKNVDLSQRRAESVRQYLIRQGIEETRLTAVGYGPDKPVADNKRAAGRAQNRRVEFQLITQ